MAKRILIACVAFVAACSAHNAAYNCGPLGGACCVDGACQPGGTCVGGTCKQCGAAGDACCGGGQCGSGLACANNVCAVCGAAGPGVLRRRNILRQRRLLLRGWCRCCAPSGRSVSDGRAASCKNGSWKAPAAAKGRAAAPATAARLCAAGDVVCAGHPVRGLRWKPDGKRVAAIALHEPGVAGNGQLCAPCGGAGEPCCDGGSCSASGLRCAGDVCAACGGAGQVCCTGGLCGSGCCDTGVGDQTVCIADGSMCASTGTTCAKGSCPAPAGGGCGDGVPFATFVKGCAATTDCVFGVHQTDCCGSTTAIGINHSQLTLFNAAEKSWDASCAECQCAAQPLKTEDGASCTANAVMVSCDGGNCTTHCN